MVLHFRRQLMAGLFGGGIPWLLNDSFLDTRAAGAVHGTPATPGPGTRVVVDTGDDLSVASSELVFAGNITGFMDPRYNLDAVTRSAGIVLIFKANGGTGASNGLLLGWVDNVTGGLAVFNSGIYIRIGSSFSYFTDGFNIGAVSPIIPASNTDYELAIVLRASGGYLFLKYSGTWTLLWHESVASDATVYPLVVNSAATADGNVSYFRIPVETWLPTPLAYDTFTRANGAIGSSEAAGPDAQVITPKVWTGVTFTIATNKAINTPAEGSDLLASLNGNFADWTADDPDDWMVVESGATDITEVATGEAHADAPNVGGGFCNIYRSGGGTGVDPGITQIILTIGQWYLVSLLIDTATSGVLNVLDFVGGINSGSLTTAATHLFTGRARHAGIRIRTNADPTDMTFDDVTVKQLTLSTLFSSLVAGNQNVVADVDLVITALTQAGLVLCLDSAATPANFLIAYHDGTIAHLEKCVAGTYTSLISAAAAYSANATLRVIKDGTSVDLFYNEVKVGTTQTVSDAGIKDNTIHGLFSTYPGNTLDNFMLFPRKEGYSILDKWTKII